MRRFEAHEHFQEVQGGRESVGMSARELFSLPSPQMRVVYFSKLFRNEIPQRR